MKVYYICESCEDVFFEGQLGDSEGIVTVNALCEDCAKELGISGETPLINHFYS